MKTFRLTLVLLLLLTLCLFAVSSAQVAGQIKSMKLLTSDVGWAATDKNLFWTTAGGAQWKDITPKLNHKRQQISSVFFLDTSTGWVLLGCGDDRDPIADDVCFEFASTINAGESWSVVHPKIVDPVPPSVIIEDGQGLSGTTFLNFADTQHGWAIFKRNLHAEASSGEMLRTVDGGKTWTQLPKATLPMADHFRFVNGKDGWIAGGGQPESDLFVTHDGGGTWSRVAVKPPAEVKVEVWPPKENGVWPDYQLPFFENPGLGYLIGSYWDGAKSTSVLFSTADFGNNWKFEKVLPSIEGVITIFRETLLAVSTPQLMDRLTLRRLPLASKAAVPASVTADIHQVPIGHNNLGAGYDALDMFDDAHGWLLADELLATSDGGATWTDITPKEAALPRAAQGENTKKISATRQPVSPASSVSSGFAPAASNVSSHLSFDKSRVPCPIGMSKCSAAQSLTVMQTLMNSSPFYDTGLYLPGSPNRGSDSAVNQSWVQGAEQQGWGLIPIWFGLQSPCIIGQPNVTQYFGPTAANASTQGTQQADQAVAAAKALGLPASIIYTDIENYTVNSTCSPVVQAYVNAWVTEIHAYSGYLAGIYANPAPINSDISNLNVAQADAIWITKVNNPPQVTIWNQGINDKLWPNGQRTHQFLIDQTGVTWGGVTFSPSVDEDIDNGPVVNVNAIAKPYTYSTPTDISCPGAINTYPTAINDMNNGAFINGPGKMGTVVGMFQTGIGTPNYAFQNTGGTCAIISISGSTVAEATGINNLGQIVGYFEDSNGAFHGFLQNPGKSPIQIDYAGAAATYLYGINDAGQAVGYAYSPRTFYYQSFIYFASKFYPLGISGGGQFQYTLARGINGQATITGIYYFQPFSDDFELSAIPPTWNGTVIDLTPGGSSNTQALGINANDELTGYYFSSACNDTQNECGFQWSGGFALNVLTYGTHASAAEGINDFAQVVGAYTDSTTQYSHGLLWTHQ